MEPELTYLFRNKVKPDRWTVTVANPSNKLAKFSGMGRPIDRQSPVGKLYDFLRTLLKDHWRSFDDFERHVFVESFDGFEQFNSQIMQQD